MTVVASSREAVALSLRDLLSAQEGLLVLGATGRQARLEIGWLHKSGDRVAAGVTPGRGGQSVEGVPVYDSVEEALRHHRCSIAMNYAPAVAAADAAIEAFEAGVEIVVISAEGVPLHRLALAIAAARRHRALLIGPNSQGLVIPGVGRVGCPGGSDPESRFGAGQVAIVSRSGGMTSELAMHIRSWGWGTSVQLALGGSPIVGTTLSEGVMLAQRDPSTRVAVVFGEPSSRQEYALANAVESGRVCIPVIAMIAGRAADALPATLTFGHAPRAGSAGEQSVAGKLAALRAAGVSVATNLEGIRSALEGLLGRSASASRAEGAGGRPRDSREGMLK